MEKQRKIPFWQNRKVVPYLYILPNMILFMVFMIIPLFMAGYYSTVKWNGLGAPQFIGLQNYSYILTDAVFRKSLLNTVIYSAISVPVGMVLSFILALFLNSKVPARGIFRTVIYAPAVVSAVVAGTIFNWIFQDQFGVLNYVITLFGGTAVKWANDPRYAMVMIVVATIWQKTGYNMVIYLAGLQSVPQELMESAQMDGCNTLQKIRYVTIPLLRNTTGFVLVTSLINSFRSFDLVYSMTKGGPLNSTKTVVMYIYEQAFNKNYYGRASAAGVVLFVIMAAFTIIRNKMEKED